MTNNVTTDREEWIEARKSLMEKEKAYLRAGDELATLRRELPKFRIAEDYVFQGPKGPVSLSDLFEGRSQLIVQHFMFGTDWEEGCPFCSFWADGYNPMIVHMNQRDISFAVVSRGPIDKLEAYKNRMGWSFTWVSSINNSFNIDFDVSPTEEQMASGTMRYNYRNAPIRGPESHGVSVFERDSNEDILHTYSTYARGMDRMNADYGYIDLTPKGRQEDELPYGLAWVKRHDQY